METQNVEFEEVNPTVWKPAQDGDMIEGKLVNKQPSPRYDNQIYHIETKSNGQLAIFGTTVLDDRMAYVNVGESVRITYKGTQKNSKGQDTKIFKVERQKPPQSA